MQNEAPNTQSYCQRNQRFFLFALPPLLSRITAKMVAIKQKRGNGRKNMKG